MGSHNPYEFFGIHTITSNTKIERLVHEYYKARLILTFYYGVCFLGAVSMFMALLLVVTLTTTTAGAILGNVIWFIVVAWSVKIHQRLDKSKQEQLQKKWAQIKQELCLNPTLLHVPYAARRKLLKSLNFILHELEEI